MPGLLIESGFSTPHRFYHRVRRFQRVALHSRSICRTLKFKKITVFHYVLNALPWRLPSVEN